MLLRTAIGWHFFYEGYEKLHPPDGKPFTAEPYLRAAVGPLAPKFREIVPDVDSTSMLKRDENGTPSHLKARWAAQLNRLAAHFRFTAEQRQKADEALKSASATADAWFLNMENAQNIKKYEDELARIEHTERDPKALDYQRKLAYKQRAEVEKERKELIEPINAWTETLHASWSKLVQEPQEKASGPLVESYTQLDWVNLTTKYGMLAVGLGLMLGLYTRLSALGAVAFLTLFYLSQPPWPGLPEGPKLEGHYLYVNKNLIELLACMVIATTRSGLWLGIDALLFGRFARRRDARAFNRWLQRAAESNPEPVSPDPYSDPQELRRRGIVTGGDRR